MMTNVVPVGVLKDIERLERAFIQGDQQDKRRVHAVGWSTMSKVCRGMAMCNMKAMNKACLMKLGWQLRTKGSGLWCQVMNGKYIRNVFMDSLIVKNYDFDLWKALANLWSDLEEGEFWVIGQRDTVNVWRTKWVDRDIKLMSMAHNVPDQF